MNAASKPDQPAPRAPEDQQPRSIGQILEQHLDEIIGPETAARYRKAKEGEQ